MALPHLDQVYTSGLYLTRNRDDAEELLQETYLRAYRFWHQFTPGTNCKAWLMTILHNTLRSRCRQRQRDQQVVEFNEEAHFNDASAAPAPSDPEALLLWDLFDDEVESALTTLPREFLEVIVLVDIQELSYEEAAAALGCPIGTVRSRLSRARRVLQARLQAYAVDRGYAGRRCAVG